MLLVTLGKISLGAIHKQIKTVVALKYFAVQQLRACLNGHGRGALPAAIDALVDHDTLVLRELSLTDLHAHPVQYVWTSCCICRIALCELIGWKLWQRWLGTRHFAGDCN